MKRLLPFLVFTIAMMVSAKATTYYTVDVGNGPEWSLDGVTACNCTPNGNGKNDKIIVRHNISFPYNKFMGEMLIDSNNVTLTSALYFKNAQITINPNASLKFNGAAVLNRSEVYVLGDFKIFGTISIIRSNIYGTGKVDLKWASCSSYLSSVNGIGLSGDLCGKISYLYNFNVNFWNGATWSKGQAPNSCGELAAILADYDTHDGDITAGMLWIVDKEVEISSGGYIDVCDRLVNSGTVIVKNKGSLVQRDGCTLDNFGTFKIQREGQHDEFNYNIWSSPIEQSKHLSQVFPQTNPCDMYVFDSESQSWKFDYTEGYQTTCAGNPVTFTNAYVIPGGDGIMDPGMGYFAPGPSSVFSVIREFEGTPNNGDITVPISSTKNGSSANWTGNDWNMVGNPYPSSIDGFEFWNENAVENQVISDGIYLWVEATQPPYDQFASYLVWNPIGSTYMKRKPGQNNGSPYDGVIPSCSGFWVTANDQQGHGYGNGNSVKNLTFSNDMRITNGVDLVPQISNKRSEESDVDDILRQRAWFTLTTDNENYDQILIGFHPRATDGLDLLYDARFNPGASKVYMASILDGIPYTIQGLGPENTNSTRTMELLISTEDTSQHYITLDSTLYIGTDKEVYLIDSLKHTRERLHRNIPLALQLGHTGMFQQRFYLELITHVLSTESDIADLSFDGRVWTNENNLFFDNFQVPVNQISLYNLMGQEVMRESVNSRNSSMTLPDLATGIYIVKMTSKDKREFTKKINIQ